MSKETPRDGYKMMARVQYTPFSMTNSETLRQTKHLARYALLLLAGCCQTADVCPGHDRRTCVGQDEPNSSAAPSLATDRFLGERFRAAFAEAARTLQKKTADGSARAATHVQLAEVNAARWCFGFASREDTLPAARRAAEEALRLERDLAGAHRARGIVALCNWQWEHAERSLREATSLKPDDATSRHWYALCLAALGRKTEAREGSGARAGTSA